MIAVFDTATTERPRGGESCGRARENRWMTASDRLPHPPNTRASGVICAYLWKPRAAEKGPYAGRTVVHPQSTGLITTTAFSQDILITTESESM